MQYNGQKKFLRNQTITHRISEFNKVVRLRTAHANNGASLHSTMQRRKDLKDNIIGNHSRTLRHKSKHAHSFMYCTLRREIKNISEFLEDTYIRKMSYFSQLFYTFMKITSKSTASFSVDIQKLFRFTWLE